MLVPLTKPKLGRQLEGRSGMLTEPLEQTETEDLTKPEAPVCDTKPQHHARGLLAIALFKLAKAAACIAIGFGALHLIHADVGDVVMKITSFFHLDPEGHIVDILQDKADLLSGHRLRQFSMLTFGYAGLSMIEGIGLYKEKTWAEYLTLILTICALPWDVTEFFKHQTPMRAGVVVINLIMLAYLLWFIRNHRKEVKQCEAEIASK
jgi:uncharacterized membrane protein (DUF2068 family)